MDLFCVNLLLPMTIRAARPSKGLHANWNEESMQSAINVPSSKPIGFNEAAKNFLNYIQNQFIFRFKYFRINLTEKI